MTQDNEAKSPNRNVILLADHPYLIYEEQPGLFDRLTLAHLHPVIMTYSKAAETYARLKGYGLRGEFQVLDECQMSGIDTEAEKAEKAEAYARTQSIKRERHLKGMVTDIVNGSQPWPAYATLDTIEVLLTVARANAVAKAKADGKQ